MPFLWPIIGVIVAFGATIYILALVAYGLARLNLFWTIVPEAQAKTVFRNGEFHKMVMSYRQYRFPRPEEVGLLRTNSRGETVEIALWDVLSIAKHGETWTLSDWFLKITLLDKLLKGVKWIGIPPFTEIFRYHFTWTSLTQKETVPGGGLKNVFHTTDDKNIDHILLQPDVYVSRLEKVETQDRVQVDIIILLTLAVKNPYKALFRVQRWLETIQNQIGGVIREVIFTRWKFEALFKKRGAASQEIQKALDTPMERAGRREPGELVRIRNDYGVRVEKIQFHDVSPTDPEIARAAARQFQAEMERQAILVRADAEKKRILQVYGTVKGLGPEGMNIRAFEALENAGANITLVAQSVKELVPTMQVADTTRKADNGGTASPGTAGTPPATP